jgi:hypothetical protein
MEPVPESVLRVNPQGPSRVLIKMMPVDPVSEKAELAIKKTGVPKVKVPP